MYSIAAIEEDNKNKLFFLLSQYTYYIRQCCFLNFLKKNNTICAGLFPSLNTHIHAKSLQSRLMLCDTMDYSPPGSSVHGYLQAVLEWVAMPSSRGSS